MDWGYRLIELGTVASVDGYAGQRIISIKLGEAFEPSLNIGEKVFFGDAEGVAINGWKLWSDRSTLDILVDDGCENIEIGEPVQISIKQPDKQ